MDTHPHSESSPRRFVKTPLGIVLLVAIGAISLVLIYDHRGHVFSGDGLLVTLLVACVGSHFFLHGRHGGHGASHGGGPD